MFAATPVVTLRTSLECLRLKLWDTEHGRLVRFPVRRAGARVGSAAWRASTG
jgi:hypothetical protein